MQVKVLKKFRDKRNGKIYKQGAIIEVTKERLEEINKTDKTLVEPVNEETTETVEETPETAEETPEKKKKAKKNKSE